MATDLGAAPARMRGHPVRWAALAVAALVLLPGVVVLGSRLGKDATLVRSVLVGKPAPAFSLVSVDGEPVTSAQLAGRPYVVNFWASWCVPCREEHGALQAFYERYESQGVEIVGVVFSDTAENARAYREELGGDWPLVMDDNGRTAVDFGVRGPPESFVVDGQGIIYSKFIGKVTLEALERELAGIGFGGSGG